MNLRSTSQRQASAAEHVRRAVKNLSKALAELRDSSGSLPWADAVQQHMEELGYVEERLRAYAGVK